MITKTVNKIKNDKFLTNSSIFFVGSFLASFGNYIFHFLMARMLTIESYGELQSLLALSVIVGIPGGVLSTVLVKYAAAFKAKKQFNKIYSLFSFFTKKVLFASIIFFIFFIFLSGYIANFLNLTSSLPVIILGTSFLVVFLQSINSGILQGLQKFKDISIISVISALFKILLAVLLVKLGFEINGAMGAIVLASLIAYLISFLPIKFLFKQQKEKIEIKEIFQYSFPVFFALLFMALLYNIDVILVKHFFSPEIAGQYGALAVIGHIIFFIGGPVVAVMFPMTATAHTNNSNPAQIFKKTIFLVGLVGLGILFFYFFFPNLIIKILVGAKFLSISKFLGWFSFAMFLYAFINLFLQYFLSIHKTKCVYLAGIGVLLQIILISVWHNSLWQIIWIMNVVMGLVLASLVIYYLKIKKTYESNF
ncbi:oligosaccharide flippase family protein [Candidatus Parcubacteria bacterium]|nr:oligosaccharide flippase family protein [Candidatus Parcubacteria bacterium]